jgi:hypothetical protein
MEILGNPHLQLRFPPDPNLVAYGIRRALDTIALENAEIYADILANPEQPREIDPYLWTAACTIVHCLCVWHYAHQHRGHYRCPNFLAPHLEQPLNGAESLLNLRGAFDHFVIGDGEQRVYGYDIQAAVMMKIREPYTNWRLDPDGRRLVENILKLAHVVSQTAHFRNDLYLQAIALYPNQQAYP